VTVPDQPDCLNASICSFFGGTSMRLLEAGPQRRRRWFRPAD
jgi:hypothetical protein